MQTLKQIESEAQRRVKEDGCPRVVYITGGARIGICLIKDFEQRPALDRGLSIVWPDKIEIL